MSDRSRSRRFGAFQRYNQPDPLIIAAAGDNSVESAVDVRKVTTLWNRGLSARHSSEKFSTRAVEKPVDFSPFRVTSF
jgi:hypothetical protein